MLIPPRPYPRVRVGCGKRDFIPFRLGSSPVFPVAASPQKSVPADRNDFGIQNRALKPSISFLAVFFYYYYFFPSVGKC